MMIKSFVVGGLLMISTLCVAQEHKPKFSPEKFDQELRQYIVKEASLTQQEADAFFPVYKEMREKQRLLFNKQKQLGKDKPSTDEGCKKAVAERDAIELEQKKIQQTYHNRFFDVLPASKVYDVLKAEDRFHRHKLQQWGKNKGKAPKKRD